MFAFCIFGVAVCPLDSLDPMSYIHVYQHMLLGFIPVCVFCVAIV